MGKEGPSNPGKVGGGGETKSLLLFARYTYVVPLLAEGLQLYLLAIAVVVLIYNSIFKIIIIQCI